MVITTNPKETSRVNLATRIGPRFFYLYFLNLTITPCSFLLLNAMDSELYPVRYNEAVWQKRDYNMENRGERQGKSQVSREYRQNHHEGVNPETKSYPAM